MKTKEAKPRNKKNLREQILQSAIASFSIEGIKISKEMALETLKKVEFSLGK